MAREQMIARSLEAIYDLASCYGASWSPAVSRVYDMTRPQAEEAIGSWLIRYAIQKNCSPGKILSRFGITWQKPIYWLDFDAASLPWNYVAKLMSCAPEWFKVLTPDLGQLLQTPLLLGLHVDPMRMQPHLRYCVECLTGDAIPYYRNTWRLASTWICNVHGSVMRDYCPVCHAPLFWNYAPHNRIRISDLRMCYHCKGDLCATKADAALPLSLTAELTAIQMEFTRLLGFQDWVAKPSRVSAIQDPANDVAQKFPLATQRSLHQSNDEILTPTFEATIEQLTRNIWFTDFPPQTAFPEMLVGVGIDARAVFDRDADEICKALAPYQNLYGTTIWWPRKDLLKNPLSETWTPKDFDRSRRWIHRQCICS